MRCLWITRQDPRPRNSGELIYSNGLLHALAEEHPSLEITVLTHQSQTPTPSSASPPNITWQFTPPIPSRNPFHFLSTLPSDAARLGNPHMRKTLTHLLAQNWHALIVDQAACGWVLRIDKIPLPPLVYIAHNHESSVRSQIARSPDHHFLEKFILASDAQRYVQLEKELLAQSSLLTTITSEDQQRFRQEAPKLKSLVLTPGFQSNNTRPPELETLQASPRRLILTGAFQWFAKRRNLISFLEAAHPVFPSEKIELSVVGKTDPAFFQELQSRFPWAQFHPNVPSIDPFLTDARIGILPDTLGGGFKLKALDYIFRGLPLAAVTDSLRGLPDSASLHAISAHTHPELVKAIVQRIDDLPALHQAAQSAFLGCQNLFHWKDRGQQLAQALAELPSP
ncbi:MAG: glycosyltransferase [Verrucomicrobiota bacterium]